MAEARNEEVKKETRNTKQKRLIIDCLNKYGSNHMTAEELLNLIHRQDDKISIATVYRNLRLLEEQGLVRKVFVSDDATAYYEAADNAKTHSHHHLICRQCGAIIDFEEDLLESAEKIIEQTKGFTIQDHRVTFFGICAACNEKNRLERENHPDDKPEPLNGREIKRTD